MSVEVKRMNVLEDPKSSLRAFADICIAGRVTIKGCRVVEGKNGLFASMPQTKGKDDKYYPIVYVETDELKKQFEDAVIGHYNNVTGGGGENAIVEEEDPFAD